MSELRRRLSTFQWNKLRTSTTVHVDETGWQASVCRQNDDDIGDEKKKRTAQMLVQICKSLSSIFQSCWGRVGVRRFHTWRESIIKFWRYFRARWQFEIVAEVNTFVQGHGGELVLRPSRGRDMSSDAIDVMSLPQLDQFFEDADKDNPAGFS